MENYDPLADFGPQKMEFHGAEYDKLVIMSYMGENETAVRVLGEVFKGHEGGIFSFYLTLDGIPIMMFRPILYSETGLMILDTQKQTTQDKGRIIDNSLLIPLRLSPLLSQDRVTSFRSSSPLLKEKGKWIGGQGTHGVVWAVKRKTPAAGNGTELSYQTIIDVQLFQGMQCRASKNTKVV